MDNNQILLLGGLGIAAYFLFPSISSAAGFGNKDETLSVAGSAGESNIQTIDLVDIAGANWSLPLYLTLERDFNLGILGLETLYTGLSTAYSVAKTSAQVVGEALSTALSYSNSVAREIVVPAIVDAAGVTANVVKTGAGYAWTGLKSVGSGIYYIGGKIYDGTTYLGETAWQIAKTAGGYVWDGVAGSWKYVKDLYKESHIFRDVTKGLVTIASSAAISIGAKKDDGDKVTGTPTSNTVPLGYLSKTNFEMPKALPVIKVYNDVIKDTRLVTDNEALEIAKNTGYKEIARMGYCSPEPFRGCTQIFQLFNKTTLDTIVVTNSKILPRLTKQGYESHGIIGYCKALS